jgi:hypothetical protein
MDDAADCERRLHEICALASIYDSTSITDVSPAALPPRQEVLQARAPDNSSSCQQVMTWPCSC